MLGYIALIFTAYYIQAGASWFPLMICLPRILTVPALKILRNFPDYRADAIAGKRTLVVIFGRNKMSYVYIALVAAAILLFIPSFTVSHSPFALLNIIPVAYLAQSLLPMLKGSWRQRAGIERACRAGFKGLLLVPLTLSLTFLLAGLLPTIRF